MLAVLSAAFAGPLSKLVLGFEDTTLWLITTLGLWSFTNLEMAYALLRVDEMTRTYVRASLTNVALTVGLSVWLVVGEGDGARGLLAGNFIASTVVLLGLWWTLRHRVGVRIDGPTLSPMLRFGLPTVPAEVSVFALNLIDRTYLYRVESPKVAGLYSLAVKLAAVVIFATRAFQYAWPPLAYSITDDHEAGRLYALVATYYVLRHRHDRVRPDPAGPLGGPAAGRPRLLRRLPGPAVGVAGLGDVRALPDLRGDRRPREGDDPQLPGGAGRAGRQRRAARRARAAASGSRARASRCAAPIW